MFEGEPLWFPSDELLTRVLHAEINAVMQLLVKYPDLPDQFDAPDATVPQRNVCFALLAHRKVISTILVTLAGRYIEPSLNDEQSQALRLTYDLVADDAPAWALEMQRVIDGLPAHMYALLPEPLRRGGYNPDDTEQMDAIESAKKILSTAEQIQTFTERVIDQHLQRLAERWSVAASALQTQQAAVTKQFTRKQIKRTGWEQRLKLYSVVQKVLNDNPGLQGMKFCAELDKHHAPPLYDWKKRKEWRDGLTWKEAWNDRGLRRKIRRVRQEAMKKR
jgi:hypothetical protein